jgi:hypothetical protein
MEGWIMLRIATAIVAAAASVILMTGGHSRAHAAESQSERFTNYQVPTGAEMTPAQAQTKAVQAARMAHQGGALKLTMVHATFAQAHAVLMGEPLSAADESGAAEHAEEMRSPVWVTMITASAGTNFTPIGPVPRGQKGPAGTVMVVVADAHTGFVKEEYVGPTAPEIGLLGPTLDATVATESSVAQSARHAPPSEQRPMKYGLILGHLSFSKAGWPVTIANTSGYRLVTKLTKSARRQARAGSFSFREIAGSAGRRYVISAPRCGKRVVRVWSHSITKVTLHCSMK